MMDILNRMDVDTTEALMLGYGDLMDLDVSAGACADMVVRVMASAMASYLATVTGGRVDIARDLVEGALNELRRRTHERLDRLHSEGIAADVKRTEPRGRG